MKGVFDLTLLLVIFLIDTVFCTSSDGRLVGGRNVTIEDFPYMMSLQYRGQHICNAFKIKNIGVTAAQCLYGLPLEEITVRVGSSFRDTGGTIHEIYDVNFNDRYNPKTLDYDEVAFNIKGVRESSSNDDNLEIDFGKTFTIDDKYFGNFSGWGKTEIGAPFANQLQNVVLPVVNHKVCQSHYPGLTKRQFCAGYLSGVKGPCLGDAGGPFIIQLEDGKKQLAGWFSYSYGCAQPNYPGVFTEFRPDKDSVFYRKIQMMK